MSFLYIEEPSANTAIYQDGALVYKLANQYAIGSISNNTGKLRVEVGSTGATEAEEAGFVYLSILEGEDNTPTAVVPVLLAAAGFVTVDYPYDAGLSASGNMRIIATANFTIETGYTGDSNQPLISNSLRMTPDMQGLYVINAARAAKARLSFVSDPGTNQAYANNTKVSVYPDVIGSKTPVNAYKHIEGSAPAQTIAYQGCRQLVSRIISGKYQVELESEAQSDISVDGSLDLLGYTGKTYQINFATSIAEEFTTVDLSPSAEGFQLITTDSGQTITGLIIKAPTAGAYEAVFSFNNGVTTISYTIAFTAVQALSNRVCCGGLMLLFWHPLGGWVYYQFNLRTGVGNFGGSPIFTRDQARVRAVSYEAQIETLSLLAEPESELIFDYLNSMFFTMEIYLQVESDYIKYTLQEGVQVPKFRSPFLALSNRWQITLQKDLVQTRINEGK